MGLRRVRDGDQNIIADERRTQPSSMATSVATASGTAPGYPLYDAHGNMVGTLMKNGTGYAFNAWRIFDAWGNIRSANGTGDPKGRYCANLGHKQDDESGLVYMRARYCERASGRFVGEDPGRHGANWYVYGSDDPVNRVDTQGRDDQTQELVGAFLFLLGILDMVTGIAFPDPATAM